MKRSKLGMIKIAITLWSAALVPNGLVAAPECWLTQVGDRIPNAAPTGRKNNSICFVLWISGGENGVEWVDLFDALEFRLRDRSKKILPLVVVENGQRPVTPEDCVTLYPNRAVQRAYEIFLDDRGSLDIPNPCGGDQLYVNIPKGRYYVDVILNTVDNPQSPHSDVVTKFENGHVYRDGGSPFFKGVVFCGTLTIRIGGASHKTSKAVSKRHRAGSRRE